MRRTRSRPMLRTVWLAALMAFVIPASVVSGADPLSRSPQGDASARPDVSRLGAGTEAAKVAPGLQKAEGTIAAFVRLAKPSAVSASAAAKATGRNDKRAARLARAGTKVTAAAVVKDLKGKDAHARELYKTTDAISGVAVMADAAGLRSLAARSDVVSISRLTANHITNSNTAVLTRVLDTWQSLGTLGSGVSVGIIDTGIDYTHANFGGAGTVAAYQAIDPEDATGVFPTAKVVGGIDLAGDAYNADSGDPGEYTPFPDDNPLDCNDHGSHVAGTAAGYGVNGDRSTFAGDYTSLDAGDLESMWIGPGMAPLASLYAIKVFGCGGSTFLVPQALDWALDPNGDADFSDHLDVVNLSLGSPYKAPDDPENAFVREVTKQGVLVIFSAGNDNDLFDIGSGAPEALHVASTVDSRTLFDGAVVQAPADVAGTYPGQYGIALANFDVTGSVRKLVSSGNLDGCNAFSAADAAAVAGRFAWLEWDENGATRRCGSAARSNNAAAAGAIGVILTSTVNQFSVGIAGSAFIPAFQLTANGTNALRPAVDAGTLDMRLQSVLRLTASDADPSISDAVSGFTSRGTRSPGPKPDVAAPGTTIVSTLSGSGSDRLSISGTSMAAPHITGIAALLRGTHPTWKPAEVKAAIMNTANHDVFAGLGQTGPIEAPTRVGSGRVDALDALTNNVIAFDKGSPAAVSVGFGVVEVGAGPVSKDRTIKVTNKGTTKVKYNVSYKPINPMPGVAYQLDKTTVSVDPGKSADIRVRLRIADPTALRKTLDATMEREQEVGPGFALPRQYVADSSGLVILTATSGTTVNLRVPVYAAPKPTAEIKVPKDLTIHGTGTGFLGLTGRGLNQGTGDERYLSIYSALELGATSPRLPACGALLTSGCTINGTAKGGDLRYVGAGTTAPQENAGGDPIDSKIVFGIATWDDWAHVGGHTVPFVDIDTTGDGIPDYETYVFLTPDTDVLEAWTVELSGGFPIVDIEPINFFYGIDTNVFDSNVLLMPVNLDALGIDPTDASHRITYEVGIDGRYEAPNDGVVDFAPPVSYDPLKPGLWAEGAGTASIFVADPGSGLTIHKDAAALAADGSNSLLVINLHNKSGQRAQVVKIKN